MVCPNENVWQRREAILAQAGEQRRNSPDRRQCGMDNLPPPPYAALTPDCVLDALDSVGLPCDGRLLALNSYENRVYQVYR